MTVEDPTLAAPIGTLPGDPQTLEDAIEMRDQYEAEGHLVRYVVVTDAEDDEHAWAATCSCGAGSYFDGEKPEDAPAVLGSNDDARWWHRGHRSAQGLDWQVFCPVTCIDREADAYRAEGHLIGASEMPDGTWLAVCSCSEGHTDAEALTTRCSRQESEELARAWSDRHREIHGLAPQQTIPEIRDSMPLL